MGILALVAAPGHAAEGDGAPRLSLPVACAEATGCLIQNDFDRDPGPGVRDRFCGAATYDGHDGIDFRAPPGEAGSPVFDAPVFAAAGGTVIARRDSAPDGHARSPAQKAAVAGVECGNGVLIDHGGGWRTQYCHLRRGSVRPAVGETVARGAVLGAVGSSGLAEFAHLHFEVRHGEAPVDPFGGDGPACAGSGSATLWTPEALSAMPAMSAAVLGAGFASAPVDADRLESGAASDAPPGAEAPAFIFFGRFMNLAAGDIVRLRIDGPAGALADHRAEPLDRAKAHYVAYAGRKRRGPAWPAGRYVGTAQIIRDGAVILETVRNHEISADGAQ